MSLIISSIGIIHSNICPEIITSDSVHISYFSVIVSVYDSINENSKPYDLQLCTDGYSVIIKVAMFFFFCVYLCDNVFYPVIFKLSVNYWKFNHFCSHHMFLNLDALRFVFHFVILESLYYEFI